MLVQLKEALDEPPLLLPCRCRLLLDERTGGEKRVDGACAKKKTSRQGYLKVETKVPWNDAGTLVTG